MDGDANGATGDRGAKPGDRALRGWLSIRGVRLATGLILLIYVGSHLLDHSLGNISIGAMEAGLLVQKWIWQSVAGTVALYGALAVHFCLGLWAFYERRHFGWTRAEVMQLSLGLLIPFLLMNHLFVTRIALAQYGMQKGYAQELYSFWVASPELGVLQVSVLIVAWLHGCIGLYLWLRLRPWFEKAAPALLCGSIILPLLALLGFFQGGRMVLALANDPAWQAANLASWQVGRPAENAMLRFERNCGLLMMLVLVGLVLLARGARAVRDLRGGTIRVRYPDGRMARIPHGFSVLEASRSSRIPHASVCGGRARCSTCRVRVVAGSYHLPAPSATERAVLERVRAGPGVRLACQFRPRSDITVVPLLPGLWNASAVRMRGAPRQAEERFIVVVVADMRDSTRLADTRLPFDAVFVVERFVNAIGAAVTEAGGQPNQFTGDGLFAMFGLTCGPEQACRQAMRALALIGRNIVALNTVLVGEGAEPVRFGIGVHAGAAVVGEVGYGESRVFTTLGDAANVAARLEAMCKEFGCEAVVSQAVLPRSGHPAVGFGEHEISVRGRDARLVVYTIAALEGLAGVAPSPGEAGAGRGAHGRTHADREEP